jgi:hypothetical protein
MTYKSTPDVRELLRMKAAALNIWLSRNGNSITLKRRIYYAKHF